MQTKEGLGLPGKLRIGKPPRSDKGKVSLESKSKNRVQKKIAASFRQANITDKGIDMEQEGLAGPSSTWTYMINDNPTGEVIERLTRGLRKMVLRKAQ